MDRREAMAISGSASFYMQRGIPGSGSVNQSGLNVSSNINQLTNASMPFQSNTMGSTLQMDTSAAMSPHGNLNVGAQSAMQQPQSEVVKRKRGRPRKYGPDGAVSLALSPSLSTHPGTISPTSQKRGRGRPPGTGRKQQLASLGEWLSGSAGMGFTPHIITIAVGEDIATKIMSFSQQGPRAICILSANGAVSTVTLRQPSTSGGTVTYEGRFEILCLSGSYLVSSNAGSRNRTGGLSVSLASPDGRVVGGGVGGMLIAASPVQVIVGSFIWGGSKTKNKKEGIEGGRDMDHHQTVENPVTPSNIPPNQNLTSPSSVGLWPSQQSMDMRNSHVDIDLMRG
ncbi:AT-hook motif nuclear-localized protein 11 [Euphorbia peplus]|nr:AT-hook motif nuclear-localized protein 11 [Euphorbia peplus]